MDFTASSLYLACIARAAVSDLTCQSGVLVTMLWV